MFMISCELKLLTVSNPDLCFYFGPEPGFQLKLELKLENTHRGIKQALLSQTDNRFELEILAVIRF